MRIMPTDSPGETHLSSSREPRTPREIPEPSDPQRHWFQFQDAVGRWVCTHCGLQRVRPKTWPSTGLCKRGKRAFRSDARNVLAVQRHYLETIERVLQSQREADPRIKLGYIATA